MIDKDKKILLVEDDPAIRRAVEFRLGREGYDVVGVERHSASCEILRKEKVDLVLLDIILPKTSGLEILKQMRRIPELKAIPVMVFSNLSRESDMERAKEFGISAYLVKSEYSIEEVVKKINNFFGRIT